MKKRIWELDAFRGLCILGMLTVHFVFDLVELYGFVRWDYPPLFSLIRDWGGIAFILLSGTCATLGSRSARRGLIVFGCGMLCTLVTWGMYKLDYSGSGIVIRFGILHCLGICMLLWCLCRKMPVWLLAALGVTLAALGFVFQNVQVEAGWLFPFGLVTSRFSSGDYFPLLPHFGFFLLGAVLGRTVYAKGASLLPKINDRNPIIRFLCICGRQSLPIYLLHQPALTLLFTVIAALVP